MQPNNQSSNERLTFVEKDQQHQIHFKSDSNYPNYQRIHENHALLKYIFTFPTNEEEITNFISSYTPANEDIIQFKTLQLQNEFGIVKTRDSIYMGTIYNKKRHGMGLLISKNLKIFEGEWQNDLKHGRGFEQFPNQAAYLGYYANGKPEGRGTYQWPNGEVYDGQWHQGLKHGSGLWKGTKNDSYIGEWKHGKADGYGVHIWINGDRYEGQFKNCLKNGQGHEKFANGDEYIGNYLNGKPDGYGEYTWKSGVQYKGLFRNGMRHGKGIWARQDGSGDLYEGEYANDKKSGYGTYIWASGNKYIGQYFDDLRHGYGEMYWSNGSFYKGYWEKGIQSGEGILYVNGNLIKGIFQGNQMIKQLQITQQEINQLQKSEITSQMEAMIKDQSSIHEEKQKNKSQNSNYQPINYQFEKIEKGWKNEQKPKTQENNANVIGNEQDSMLKNKILPIQNEQQSKSTPNQKTNSQIQEIKDNNEMSKLNEESRIARLKNQIQYALQIEQQSPQNQKNEDRKQEISPDGYASLPFDQSNEPVFQQQQDITRDKTPKLKQGIESNNQNNLNLQNGNVKEGQKNDSDSPQSNKQIEKCSSQSEPSKNQLYGMASFGPNQEQKKIKDKQVEQNDKQQNLHNQNDGKDLKLNQQNERQSELGKQKCDKNVDNEQQSNNETKVGNYVNPNSQQQNNISSKQNGKDDEMNEKNVNQIDNKSQNKNELLSENKKLQKTDVDKQRDEQNSKINEGGRRNTLKNSDNTGHLQQLQELQQQWQQQNGQQNGKQNSQNGQYNSQNGQQSGQQKHEQNGEQNGQQQNNQQIGQQNQSNNLFNQPYYQYPKESQLYVQQQQQLQQPQQSQLQQQQQQQSQLQQQQKQSNYQQQQLISSPQQLQSQFNSQQQQVYPNDQISFQNSRIAKNYQDSSTQYQTHPINNYEEQQPLQYQHFKQPQQQQFQYYQQQQYQSLFQTPEQTNNHRKQPNQLHQARSDQPLIYQDHDVPRSIPQYQQFNQLPSVNYNNHKQPLYQDKQFATETETPNQNSRQRYNSQFDKNDLGKKKYIPISQDFNYQDKQNGQQFENQHFKNQHSQSQTPNQRQLIPSREQYIYAIKQQRNQMGPATQSQFDPTPKPIIEDPYKMPSIYQNAGQTAPEQGYNPGRSANQYYGNYQTAPSDRQQFSHPNGLNRHQIDFPQQLMDYSESDIKTQKYRQNPFSTYNSFRTAKRNQVNESINLKKREQNEVNVNHSASPITKIKLGKKIWLPSGVPKSRDKEKKFKDAFTNQDIFEEYEQEHQHQHSPHHYCQIIQYYKSKGKIRQEI